MKQRFGQSSSCPYAGFGNQAVALMNSVLFFYTLLLLVICVLASAISIATYLSSRRRVYLYSCGAFALYGIEIAEIFFNEFTSQNLPFEATLYYEISMPFLRTTVVTALNACVWAIILDALDKRSKRLYFAPLAIFVAANVIILLTLHEGPLQQWLYYTMRQVFLFYTYGYALYAYYRSKDATYRLRLEKYKKPLFITIALTVLVLIEDTAVIIVLPMNLYPSWLQLYLSERNFSENLLVVFFAVILVKNAIDVLSIRIKEAPVQDEVNDLDRHIEELMPFFREENKLSAREGEVLRLVILGKSNQEIASELFLAVGTVKAHVHNILVKTGQKSRDDLILFFWKH